MEEFSDPFQYIQTINPSEWPNIPKPLLYALTSMKQCLNLISFKFSDLGKKIIQSDNSIQKKFESFKERIDFINSMVITTDETLKESIKLNTDNLYNEIFSFKQMTTKDLDFKQKSNDAKISTMQEQIYTIKKTLTAMPFMKEVEKCISDACIALRKEILEFVIHNIVNPEISILSDRLKVSTENQDTYIVKFQELLEVLRNNLQVLDRNTSGRFSDLEKSYRLSDANKAEEIEKVLRKVEKIEKTVKESEWQIIEKNKIVTESINEIEKTVKEFIEKDTKTTSEIKGLKETITNHIRDYNFKIQEDEKNRLMEMKEKKEKRIKKEVERRKKTTVKKSEPKSPAKIEKVQKNETEKPEKIEKNTEEIISEHEELGNKPSDSSLQKPIRKLSEIVQIQEFPIPKPQNIAISPSNPTQISDSYLKEFQVMTEKFKLLQDSIIPIQNSLKSDKLELEIYIKELKEKLSWLPMNLNHIKDKSPNEARIFTLEARLRMEENLRVEQFNKLLALINQFKNEREVTAFSNNQMNFPQVIPGRLTARYPDRRSSADNSLILENNRRNYETERKNYESERKYYDIEKKIAENEKKGFESSEKRGENDRKGNDSMPKQDAFKSYMKKMNNDTERLIKPNHF